MKTYFPLLTQSCWILKCQPISMDYYKMRILLNILIPQRTTLKTTNIQNFDFFIIKVNWQGKWWQKWVLSVSKQLLKNYISIKINILPLLLPFFFFFGSCGILVLWSEIKPRAVKALSSNHWTSRESDTLSLSLNYKIRWKEHLDPGSLELRASAWGSWVLLFLHANYFLDFYLHATPTNASHLPTPHRVHGHLTSSRWQSVF